MVQYSHYYMKCIKYLQLLFCINVYSIFKIVISFRYNIELPLNGSNIFNKKMQMIFLDTFRFF